MGKLIADIPDELLKKLKHQAIDESTPGKRVYLKDIVLRKLKE